MRIYRKIKEQNRTIYKFLGLNIVEKTFKSGYGINKHLNKKAQKLLWGGVETITLRNYHKGRKYKLIIIFKIFSIKIIYNVKYKIYYLCNVKIRKIDEIKKQYLKHFQQYDIVYVVQSGSGEFYTMLTYFIDFLNKKYNTKNPCVLVIRKYHIDMINSIYPKISYINKQNIDENFYIFLSARDEFIYKNTRFITCFTARFYNARMHNIMNVFDCFYKHFDFSAKDLHFNRIKIPTIDEKNMLKKVAGIGLDLQKFIFIAPEAESARSYDGNFWNFLMARFKSKGYDVFLNIVGEDLDFDKRLNYKTCQLTFNEAFALARLSKAIVSLRSGFIEFLSQTNVPTWILYTPYCALPPDYFDVYDWMYVFSLRTFPFIDVSKIIEINTFEISPLDSINMILKDM